MIGRGYGILFLAARLSVLGAKPYLSKSRRTAQIAFSLLIMLYYLSHTGIPSTHKSSAARLDGWHGFRRLACRYRALGTPIDEPAVTNSIRERNDCGRGSLFS